MSQVSMRHVMVRGGQLPVCTRPGELLTFLFLRSSAS